MSVFPKITIVTPSYNQAPYLESTLQSVINQKYPNLEYIVMDGGSTDGSIEIIKKYASHLTYWESHLDEGQADAIYRGFERSTGEILGYVNSDDLLLPEALITVSNWFVANSEEEWVVGGGVVIGPKGELKRDFLGNPICNFGDRVTFKQLLFYGCVFNQPSVFWRRKAFFESGGFDRRLRFSFDYDLFLGLARRRTSGNIHKIIAAFRVHPESKTTTLHELKLEEDKLLYNKYGRGHYSRLLQSMIRLWFKERHYLASRYVKTLFMLRLIKASYLTSITVSLTDKNYD